VRAVLRRPLYAGDVIWNRSRKRGRWGRQHQTPRVAEEWVHRAAPGLQIVPDDLWARAQQRLAERTAQYTRGDRSYCASRYLLSGFAQCALCGGGFATQTREHGQHLVHFYACTSHWKRGSAVCANALVGRVDLIDAEVLATPQDDVFRAPSSNGRSRRAARRLQPAGDGAGRGRGVGAGDPMNISDEFLKIMVGDIASITKTFVAERLDAATAPLHRRISALEARVEQLERLAASRGAMVEHARR
jgi:hypothetical protein